VDPELVKRAVTIATAVDAEAVHPAGGRDVVVSVLLLGAFVAASASGMPDAVVRTFNDGVAAYERAEFGTAQRLFARSASRVPRAADAWANLGAAAWARGDTAHAVLGWQRALRLDPLDDETRERLSVVQPPIITSPSYVPPLPVNALAMGALALWLGAWMALFIQALRRTPHLRAIAGGAVVCAIVALAGALELLDRASVRGLGVVRGARDLLESPSPTSPPLADALAGDVGTLGVREGAWLRISLGGGRAGWIPAAAVLPLDAAGVD
jgi:hypothetical protein